MHRDACENIGTFPPRGSFVRPSIRRHEESLPRTAPYRVSPLGIHGVVHGC